MWTEIEGRAILDTVLQIYKFFHPLLACNPTIRGKQFITVLERVFIVNSLSHFQMLSSPSQPTPGSSPDYSDISQPRQIAEQSTPKLNSFQNARKIGKGNPLQQY